MSVSVERGQTLARLDSSKPGSMKEPSGRERSESYIRAMQQKTEAKSVNDFEKLRSLLNDHPWFSSHTKSQIDDVARFMKLKQLAGAGTVVYKEGDAADLFYIVKSGQFALVDKPSADGEAPTEHKLGEWSCFGESALRFKLPREDSVRMTSAAGELFTIAASEYQGIILKEVAEKERGRVAFLRSVPLLAQLTDEQVQVLSRCLVVQTYKPSDVIIEQNTRGSEFYFIEKGKVVAYQRTQKGEREIMTQVNSFGPGDYFGEGAVLHDEPRSADCVAMEDTVTLVLRRADFVDLLGGLEQIIEANFVARTLKAVELLAQLTDVERAELADFLMVERFPNEAKIITQGDKGDKLYIIKEGTVVFHRRAVPEGSDEGAEEVTTEIGRLFAGQVFGEGALLTDAPRRATATCAGPVTVLSLERDVFHRLFDQSLQDMLNRDFTKRRDLDEANRKDLLEFQDLEAIDILGVGTYGQVLLVSHKVTGHTYALKCMSKQRVRDMDQTVHVENERRILSMVHHPFVVNLVQTFTSKDYVFALTEVVLGGELFAYLRSVGRFRAPDAMFYLGQITLVFEYLHSLNIIYRDLKPENLLIMPNGYVKMADFGLSKIVANGESTYTLCGTPAYAAPEVYNMKGHGKPVDWWGLGVLLHELISGATPFNGDAAGIFEAMQRYTKSYPNIRLPRRLDESPAGALVLKLLHPNPAKRLGSVGVMLNPPGAIPMAPGNTALVGARAVKSHPFFENFPWNELAKQKLPSPYQPKIEGGYDTKHFYEPVIGSKESIVDLKNVDAKSVVAGGAWKL